MKVRLEDHSGAAVLHLSGRIAVGADLEDLREAVAQALGLGHPQVVLDLEDLNFIDSAGLGEMVASRRRARDAGKRLVLATPRGKVRDLMELTRIGELIETYDSVDQALTANS